MTGIGTSLPFATARVTAAPKPEADDEQTLPELVLLTHHGHGPLFATLLGGALSTVFGVVVPSVNADYVREFLDDREKYTATDAGGTFDYVGDQPDRKSLQCRRRSRRSSARRRLPLYQL